MGMSPGLGREEVDRLRRRDRLDVARLELEQHHALHELLLELRVHELRRHDLAGRHPAVGRDRETQHELALERRVLAQGPVVQRVDRAFVEIEHALDLLAAARGLVALAVALRRAAAGDRDGRDRALDLRRRALAQAAAARVAAQRGRVDAAAARADARSDQRALGERRRALDLARDLRAIEPFDGALIAQRGELLRERQEPRDLRALARLLGPIDRSFGWLLGLRLELALRFGLFADLLLLDGLGLRLGRLLDDGRRRRRGLALEH